MCAGDEVGSVVGPQGDLVQGGIEPRSPWSGGRSYCQRVRWAADEFTPQEVVFSVRSSDGSRCVRRAGNEVSAIIRGGEARLGRAIGGAMPWANSGAGRFVGRL